ncbi:uncharacterized protein LOC144113198 [Amblyomma americanum]
MERLQIVKALARAANVQYRGRVLGCESSEGERADALQDMANSVGFRHGLVHTVAKSKHALTAALACVLWLVGDASVGMVGVQIKNGRCVLNGTEIQNGKSVSLETPCESHVCDATAKSVQIMGCGPVEAPPNCTPVNGTGIFPKCCRHALCKSSSTQPLKVTALVSNLTKC